METPNNAAGRLTEAIMLAIHEHVAPHQYNRAYMAVYRVLREKTVDHVDAAPAVNVKVKRCGRLITSKGLIKLCSLSGGHGGRCEPGEPAFDGEGLTP